MAKHEIRLEHLCEVEVFVTPPIPVGPSSWGTRVIFPVVGGTVKGPKLNGKIKDFGADWGIVRGDHCFELDVRIVIETDDGAIIHASYAGIIDMTKEQAGMFLAGKLPEGLSLYTTPRFEAGHDAYAWLNRIQAVGRGAAEPAGDRLKVTYSWFVMGS